jgi:hypothetical protein
MPDRLPSLIILIGFWIPPAMAGWAAAGYLERSHVDRARRDEGAEPREARSKRRTVPYAVLAAIVLAYAAAWFLLNLLAMPPYIPGTTKDPTFRPPRAVAGLAVWRNANAQASALPGSTSALAKTSADAQSPYFTCVSLPAGTRRKE